MSRRRPRPERARKLGPSAFAPVAAAALIGLGLVEGLGERSGVSASGSSVASNTSSGASAGARVLQARRAATSSSALYRVLLDRDSVQEVPTGWRIERPQPWTATDVPVLEQLLDGASLGPAVSLSLAGRGASARIVWFVVGTGAAAGAVVRLARERLEGSDQRETQLVGPPPGREAFALEDGSGWAQAGPVAIFMFSSRANEVQSASLLRFAIARAVASEHLLAR